MADIGLSEAQEQEIREWRYRGGINFTPEMCANIDALLATTKTLREALRMPEPRLPCNKVPHTTRKSAIAHLTRLKRAKPYSTGKVYFCSECNAFHVGRKLERDRTSYTKNKWV